MNLYDAYCEKSSLRHRTWFSENLTIARTAQSLDYAQIWRCFETNLCPGHLFGYLPSRKGSYNLADGNIKYSRSLYRPFLPARILDNSIRWISDTLLFNNFIEPNNTVLTGTLVQVKEE